MANVPFDQLEGHIWMNGEMVPWADAKVHVLTHGLHYASAVFEGERAYGGEIFKMTEHNQRLHDSAEILGFEIPYSVQEIDDACVALLSKQGFQDAYVRPIAWRGSEMMAVSAQHNKIHTAIAVWPWPAMFGPDSMKGIRLDIAEWRRPAPDTAPFRAKAAGLYMICTMANAMAAATPPIHRSSTTMRGICQRRTRSAASSRTPSAYPCARTPRTRWASAR